MNNSSSENKNINDFPRCPFLEDNESRVVTKPQKNVNNDGIANTEQNNCKQI